MVSKLETKVVKAVAVRPSASGRRSMKVPRDAWVVVKRRGLVSQMGRWMDVGSGLVDGRKRKELGRETARGVDRSLRRGSFRLNRVKTEKQKRELIC